MSHDKGKRDRMYMYVQNTCVSTTCTHLTGAKKPAVVVYS